MLTLVIGGARSGKSRFAQSLCPQGARVAYIATAVAGDDEMGVRIARHRRDRPAAWVTVEEPLALAQTVARHAPEFDFILVDCLTVWLSNFCWQQRECSAEVVERTACDEIARLAQASAPSHVVMVTNEVGCGIVPETRVGRDFRDLHGIVNQWLARESDFVYHAVAGIPVLIKRPAAENI